MNTYLLNQSWQRILTVCLSLLAMIVLSSCGGKGAGAAGAGTSVASLKAASMALISSETSLGSDGRESAIITAIVKNNLNVALPNESVSFSTNDAGAILQIDSSTTDEAGRATATLTITDGSVRVITITAVSGTVTQTVSIPIVGTALAISGSNTIVFDSPTQFVLTLRDSAGSPISGAQVAVTSAAGNRVETTAAVQVPPGQIITDAQGQATFQVTALVAGADTITATSQGVSTTLDVSVSGTQLSFQSPDATTDPTDASTDLGVNNNWPVTVQLVSNGTPAAGQTVNFSVTRGTLSAASAVTNGSGVATVNVSSNTAGFSTITATAMFDGTTTSKEVEFVSRLPDKLVMQASPAVVGANIDPSGTNSAQLIAILKDASDNPVKGQRVDFTSISDPSNGRIEPGFAITDSFGVATVSFLAGPNPTGLNQVSLQAALPANPTITAQTQLTVSQIELSVQIGTGNEILDRSDTLYAMPWAAIVADSAGNPVENATVTVSVVGTRYRKGQWILPATDWVLQNSPPPIECTGEDVNRNGRLDPGEDTNGSTRLEPGRPVVASVIGTGATDASGAAELELVYPKSYGAWTEVELNVTMTTTAGTEGNATDTFWLPVLARDLSGDGAPPGSNAPDGVFGIAQDCLNPN